MISFSLTFHACCVVLYFCQRGLLNVLVQCLINYVLLTKYASFESHKLLCCFFWLHNNRIFIIYLYLQADPKQNTMDEHWECWGD